MVVGRLAGQEAPLAPLPALQHFLDGLLVAAAALREQAPLLPVRGAVVALGIDQLLCVLGQVGGRVHFRRDFSLRDGRVAPRDGDKQRSNHEDELHRVKKNWRGFG